MIHFGTYSIPQIKKYLVGRGLAVTKLG